MTMMRKNIMRIRIAMIRMIRMRNRHDEDKNRYDTDDKDEE